MSVEKSRTNPIARISLIANHAAAYILVALCLLVVSDVTGRYFFNKPIQGTMEISELLMPYVVFLAFSYALLQDKHIRVTFFFTRLSRRGQLASRIFADSLGLFLAVGYTVWSWQQFWESFLLKEAFWATPVPLWPAKLIMPVGMFLLMVCFILDLIQRTRGVTKETAQVASLE